jgi:hypothetical protein
LLVTFQVKMPYVAGSAASENFSAGAEIRLAVYEDLAMSGAGGGAGDDDELGSEDGAPEPHVKYGLRASDGEAGGEHEGEGVGVGGWSLGDGDMHGGAVAVIKGTAVSAGTFAPAGVKYGFGVAMPDGHGVGDGEYVAVGVGVGEGEGCGVGVPPPLVPRGERRCGIADLRTLADPGPS